MTPLVPKAARRYSVNTRGLAVASAVVALALTASACGGSSGGSPTASASRQTPGTTLAPAITTPTVMVNGQSVTVPREANGLAISSHFATGQNVVWTAKGFLPAWLFAAKGEPITFTNLASSPVTITLIPLMQPSFTIQPGQSHTMTPPAGIGQFEYRTSTGFHGKAQVGIFDQ